MLEAFEQVSLTGVMRTLIPPVQFELLSFLRVLPGGGSMDALPRVFCSDQALVECIGFNAHPWDNWRTTRRDAGCPTTKK